MKIPPAQRGPGLTLPVPGLDLVGLAATAVLLVVWALFQTDFLLAALAIAAAGITVATIVVLVIDRRHPRPAPTWSSVERRRAGVLSAYALLVSFAAGVFWTLLSQPGFAAALIVMVFGPFISFVIILSWYTVLKGRGRAA